MEHPFGVAALQGVVLHSLLGFAVRAVRLNLFVVFEFQQFNGQFFVGVLTALGFHSYTQPCGTVNGLHGRIGGVHMLSTCAR